MMRRLTITAAELMDEARRVVACYSPLEASRLDDAVFVDTRDALDRQRDGHIPGSIHVPRTVLEWRVDATAGLPNDRLVDPDLRLIIVCNHGYSSLLAAAGLIRMGFERCGHLEGGHRGWVRDGLPVEFEASDTGHRREPPIRGDTTGQEAPPAGGLIRPSLGPSPISPSHDGRGSLGGGAGER